MVAVVESLAWSDWSGGQHTKADTLRKRARTSMVVSINTIESNISISGWRDFHNMRSYTRDHVCDRICQHKLGMSMLRTVVIILGRGRVHLESRLPRDV
jgi:hypothetical protein